MNSISKSEAFIRALMNIHMYQTILQPGCLKWRCWFLRKPQNLNFCKNTESHQSLLMNPRTVIITVFLEVFVVRFFKILSILLSPCCATQIVHSFLFFSAQVKAGMYHYQECITYDIYQNGSMHTFSEICVDHIIVLKERVEFP